MILPVDRAGKTDNLKPRRGSCYPSRTPPPETFVVGCSPFAAVHPLTPIHHHLSCSCLHHHCRRRLQKTVPLGGNNPVADSCWHRRGWSQESFDHNHFCVQTVSPPHFCCQTGMLTKAVFEVLFFTISRQLNISGFHEYKSTRELPGVALMNISNGQIYMGNGNTFIY